MANKEAKKIYFTVTGIHYYDGAQFLEPGMEVKLEKEHDNKYDNEAIAVKMEGLGTIGHVANSVHTVVGDEAYSAGRLYDKFEEKATGKVLYNLGNAVQCEFVM